jgi:DNA-directed RNA polymerase specialized sigma24 family protein
MEVEFEQLISRVRDGDADAATALVRQYESAVRVAVRIRLSDPALRRQLDSVDICQSVLASFFFRAAAGQYDLNDPAQLIALLTKMAVNKLAMHSRRHFRQRRDVRRVADLADGVADIPANSAEPPRVAIGREMLDRAYAMMDADVREMVQRRTSGEEWTQIAAELGGTADGRRKQYQRAIDRLAAAFQIE